MKFKLLTSSSFSIIAVVEDECVGEMELFWPVAADRSKLMDEAIYHCDGKHRIESLSTSSSLHHKNNVWLITNWDNNTKPDSKSVSASQRNAQTVLLIVQSVCPHVEVKAIMLKRV